MNRRFLIKIRSWEYWPAAVVYTPVILYHCFLAIRARSFFYFSAANPSIENGGLHGESKWKILQLIPQKYLPQSVLVGENDDEQQIDALLESNQFVFPLIAKPDLGARGWNVERIHTREALLAYRKRMPVDFILQDFVDYPVELSVFYFRYPGEVKGQISSITMKELLSITGDGISSLQQLVEQKPRAFLQKDVLRQEWAAQWNTVIPKGEKIELVPYGNHCRGAMFINYNDYIDPQLEAVFDEISLPIEGFYYGRFDLRCNSMAELKLGQNFKLLELNGVSAEPGHIYHPGYSFWQAQKDIFYHVRKIFTISVANHQKNGVPYLKYKEMKSYLDRIEVYESKVSPKS